MSCVRFQVISVHFWPATAEPAHAQLQVVDHLYPASGPDLHSVPDPHFGGFRSARHRLGMGLPHQPHMRCGALPDIVISGNYDASPFGNRQCLVIFQASCSCTIISCIQHYLCPDLSLHRILTLFLQQSYLCFPLIHVIHVMCAGQVSSTLWSCS